MGKINEPHLQLSGASVPIFMHSVCIPQIPMEIPTWRPQSYNSDFKTTQSPEPNSPLHKAKSNKELSTSLPADFSLETNLPVTKSRSQEAGLYQTVTVAPDDQLDKQYEEKLEDLIEQLDLLPFKKKYSSVTVPLKVKYSTMAYRPRSPKKGCDVEQEQERMQDELDQALLRIREQLGMLTSERVSMEKQMDELTTGINEVRIQCHNQCQQRWMAANSVVRRGRSSTYTSRTKQGRNSKPQGQNSPVNDQKRPSSPGLLSPDSIVNNPDYMARYHRSVSVTDSGYGSLNRKSKSTELKTRTPSFSSTPNVSLSQGNENCGLLNPTIPEIPESPCFSQPSPSQRRRERFESTPTLYYNSYTAPRHSRSHSTGFTPPLINVTSSPDLSGKRRHDYQAKPHPPPSHRNSLPESVMNKIIEDEVDFVSVSDSLSQASLSQLSSYNDEGSPRNHGSTVIVRRSSLTGQLEHIKRKRNSYSDRVDSVSSKDSSSKSFNITRADYRVLNTGYKKNRRSSQVILSSSIETTV